MKRVHSLVPSLARSLVTCGSLVAVVALVGSAQAEGFGGWRSSPAAKPEKPSGKSEDDKKKQDDKKPADPAAPPAAPGGSAGVPSLGGLGLPLGLLPLGVGLGFPSLGGVPLPIAAGGGGATAGGATALGAGGAGASGAGASVIGGAGAQGGAATAVGGGAARTVTSVSLGSVELGLAGAALHGPDGAVALTPALVELLEGAPYPELTTAAEAEEAVKAGDRMMAEGNTSVACGMYEQALDASRTPQLFAKLARCYEANGRVASAWLAFSCAAKGASDPETRSAASAGAARLGGALPKLELQLSVASGAPAPEVFLDGRRVASALWGKPVAIDPGEHEVRVHAEGQPIWSARVTIARSNAATVVRWPPPAAPASVGEPALTERHWYTSPRVLITGAFTLLAGAGTAVGSVYTLKARADFNDKNGRPGVAQAELDDLHDRTRRLGIATTAAGGLAVIGLGLTTLFIASEGTSEGSEPKPTPRVSVGGWVDLTAMGLVFRGTL